MHETRNTWRDLQKQQTRQIILEAAKELFETLGYGKTTIRAVAKYAGVGVGTVMSHFKDKASLLSATLMVDWEQTKELAVATMPIGAGFRDQFLHLAKTFYDYYARRPALSRNLLKELLFSPEMQSPEMKAEDQQMVERGFQILLTAQQKGEIKPEVDCMLLVQALFANYCFVCMYGLAQPEPDPEQMVDQLARITDLLIQGIGTNQETIS